MVETLNKITNEHPHIKTTTLGKGFYHRALNPEIEQHLYEHTAMYKGRYLNPPLRGFSEKEMYYFN